MARVHCTFVAWESSLIRAPRRAGRSSGLTRGLNDATLHHMVKYRPAQLDRSFNERLKTEAARSSHERGWAGALHKLERYLSTAT